MSRFDIKSFCSPPDPELICGICMNVLDEPKETLCRHVFCNSCITTALENKRRCPMCRSRCRYRDLRNILPLVRNLLNKLPMKCKNFREGSKDDSCTKIIKKEFYLDHLKNCDFAYVKCENTGCKEVFLKKDKLLHMKSCDFRLVTCLKGCRREHVWKDLVTHDCIETLQKVVEELFRKNRQLQSELKELQSQKTIRTDDHHSSTSSGLPHTSFNAGSSSLRWSHHHSFSTRPGVSSSSHTSANRLESTNQQDPASILTFTRRNHASSSTSTQLDSTRSSTSTQRDNAVSSRTDFTNRVAGSWRDDLPTARTSEDASANTRSSTSTQRDNAFSSRGDFTNRVAGSWRDDIPTARTSEDASANTRSSTSTQRDTIRSSTSTQRDNAISSRTDFTNRIAGSRREELSTTRTSEGTRATTGRGLGRAHSASQAGGDAMNLGSSQSPAEPDVGGGDVQRDLYTTYGPPVVDVNEEDLLVNFGTNRVRQENGNGSETHASQQGPAWAQELPVNIVSASEDPDDVADAGYNGWGEAEEEEPTQEDWDAYYTSYYDEQYEDYENDVNDNYPPPWTDEEEEEQRRGREEDGQSGEDEDGQSGDDEEEDVGNDDDSNEEVVRDDYRSEEDDEEYIPHNDVHNDSDDEEYVPNDDAHNDSGDEYNTVDGEEDDESEFSDNGEWENEDHDIGDNEHQDDEFINNGEWENEDHDIGDNEHQDDEFINNGEWENEDHDIGDNGEYESEDHDIGNDSEEEHDEDDTAHADVSPPEPDRDRGRENSGADSSGPCRASNIDHDEAPSVPGDTHRNSDSPCHGQKRSLEQDGEDGAPGPSKKSRTADDGGTLPANNREKSGPANRESPGRENGVTRRGSSDVSAAPEAAVKDSGTRRSSRLCGLEAAPPVIRDVAIRPSAAALLERYAGDEDEDVEESDDPEWDEDDYCC